VLMLMGVGMAGAEEAQAAGKVAEGQAVKKQTVCPVMGGAINPNQFADYDGKRVYFCCGACPAEFKKDPAKYVAKLEKDGVTLDKVQVTCPVTGDKIDKTIFADYGGKRVYFCCQDCVTKFNADPKPIVAKMEKDGIVLDNAPAAAPAKGQKTDSGEKAPVK